MQKMQKMQDVPKKQLPPEKQCRCLSSLPEKQCRRWFVRLVYALVRLVSGCRVSLSRCLVHCRPETQCETILWDGRVIWVEVRQRRDFTGDQQAMMDGWTRH